MEEQKKEEAPEEEPKEIPAEDKKTKAAEETPAEEVPATNEEKYAAKKKDAAADFDDWNPKTSIGKKVKAGEITDIDVILDAGERILESEIVDILLPGMESDLLMIGQSKGKFGGGAKRIFRQTQKKTREGNKPHFATMAVIGDENGYVGVGYGKSKETVPAREKAIRNAKLNIIKIRRGSGSWESNAKTPHSIPFTVEGKCGSVIVRLIPAPKGTGLVVETEVAKILKMAGIKDIWSKSFGHTKTKTNMIMATMKALGRLHQTKIQPEHYETLSIHEGRVSADNHD